MNILTCFLYIAIGMALDAAYHHVRRVGECQAYKEGYEQGRYEERIRGESHSTLYSTPRPLPKTNTYILPTSFADRLRENRQATMQIPNRNTNNGGN